jgi:hypothetical protein
MDDAIAFCARVGIYLARYEPREDPGEDSREDREEALRLIKAAHMGGKTVVAEGADDEAKVLAGRMDEERERRLKAEAKRIAAGRYFIEEVARAVAQQRGLRESEMLKLCDAMVEAAQQGALTVRDPSTWLPVRPGQWISMARIVTPDDVNGWLDAQGAGYRWEGVQQAKPTPRPVQRQAAQEEAILTTLSELGINAQAVPAAPAGKPSPAKQAVRAKLGFSPDVMNKAWQRLRTAGRIKSIRQ